MKEQPSPFAGTAAGFTRMFHRDGRAIIGVTAPLTLPYLDALLAEVLQLFAECDLIALDLAGVAEMDSAGLQFLTVLKKTAVIKQKKLKFINHSNAVINLMEVYGVAGLFRDKIVLPAGSKKEGRFQYGVDAQEFA